MAADHTSTVMGFMCYIGINNELPARYSAPDSYSYLVPSSLRSDRIEGGRVTCTLTAKPSFLAKLIVDGSIIRNGRNITTVVVNFKLGDSRKLVYATRATFYATPMAKL